jgi:hypothetical protein
MSSDTQMKKAGLGRATIGLRMADAGLVHLDLHGFAGATEVRG